MNPHATHLDMLIAKGPAMIHPGAQHMATFRYMYDLITAFYTFIREERRILQLADTAIQDVQDESAT